MKRTKQSLVLLCSSAFLLLVWQVAAQLLDSRILLPGVLPVLSALLDLISHKPFSANVLETVLRAFESFVIIVCSATIFGILAGRSHLISIALRPFVTMLKAVPVMSIILLAFIWFTSSTVPLFSAFLMGFPVMYVQIEAGVRHLDHSLDEMLRLYEVRGLNRLVFYTLPSLAPYFVTGSRTALSMVWKVIIAAEVLTVPRYGVGSRMQLAQVQLQTDLVLSWTLIAILLTAFGDLVFDLIVKSIVKLKHVFDARRLPCNS